MAINISKMVQANPDVWIIKYHVWMRMISASGAKTVDLKFMVDNLTSPALKKAISAIDPLALKMVSHIIDDHLPMRPLRERPWCPKPRTFDNSIMFPFDAKSNRTTYSGFFSISKKRILKE